jgi:hypothetical protein
MGRKPKTTRVPRTRASNEWTEAQFWAFLRSHLRAMSMFWPPAHEVLKKGRRPYKGPDKRRKWEYQCENCQQWFPEKQIERDHIVPCGSLKCYEDIPGFVERLLCEVDGYRLLCKKCNQRRNHA